MNKRKIEIIIAFSFMALIGIIGIQYYWVHKIYEQNHFLFNQSANSALKTVVQYLKQEKYLSQVQVFSQNDVIATNILVHKRLEDISQLNSHNNQQQEGFMNVIVVNSHNTFMQDSIFTDTAIYYSSESICGNKTETTIQIRLEGDSVFHSFEAKADSLINVLKHSTIDLKQEQIELESTVDQLVWEMDKWSQPYTANFPPELIDRIIKNILNDYHLPLNFDFAIINPQTKDSIILASKNYNNSNASFSYSTKLYPNTIIPREQRLNIRFQQNPLLLRMWIPVVLSLGFTLLFMLGFILIIRNLLHHRQVSELKTTFINNMTHEFKTPIATISLAADSMLTPSVINNKEKLGYFAGMIKKENRRMNRLVEMILQMAQLENKEFKLDKSIINVNEILTHILENTELKLNGEGIITSLLQADNPYVMADPDHLTNVFYNLIDNAIKYSKDKIEIQIETSNTESMLRIRIRDKGKGIDKKDLPFIFDRFYRIDSGNINNVKGYGLGLTYVKSIIEKHSGHIKVESDIGIGSVFEIRLPSHKKTV